MSDFLPFDPSFDYPVGISKITVTRDWTRKGRSGTKVEKTFLAVAADGDRRFAALRMSAQSFLDWKEGQS